MPKIDTNDAIDQEILKLWEEVIVTCNRVMKHADVHGFEFMHIPDPDVHAMAWSLENIVCPLLDRLASQDCFSPESGIKMANIKQYTLHLRGVTLAINNNDRENFDLYIGNLHHEAMIFS